MAISMIGGGGWGLVIPLLALIVFSIVTPLLLALIGLLTYFTGDKKFGTRTMAIFFPIFFIEMAAVSIYLLKFAKEI